MNALYTAGDEVVLRIGRPTAEPSSAIWLASLLTEAGVRVPRFLHHDVIVDDGLVVFAQQREQSVAAIDWREVGTMVARVHTLDPSIVAEHFPTPPCTSFPWWDFDRLLAEIGPTIDDEARRGLTAAIERHRGWSDIEVEPVLLHGDVHPGNVIQSAAGPVLLDWDLVCIGPRAWDHGPLMTWAERWGGERGTYEVFANGYGRSLGDDPVAAAVAELRLVAATLLRVRAGRSDPVAAAEASRRLRWWRGDPDAPPWHAA